MECAPHLERRNEARFVVQHDHTFVGADVDVECICLELAAVDVKLWDSPPGS